MHRFFLAILSLSLLFAPGTSVRAQGSPAVELYPPDISAFPTVSLLLDVYQSTGIFASGLGAEAVSVLEDGQRVPATSLLEMAVPLQIVVAVNQGAGLDAREPSGLSRFERLAQVLGGWAQTRPADLPDDFSLVSQAGPVMNHGSAADLLVSLQSFRPDLRAAQPNLQSLAIAIDIAAAQTPRPGMKRAVLFITPHMDDANIADAMLPYIERALLNRVRVFVWFLDADLYPFTTSAAAFSSLAFGTGGAMFSYSGQTPFPDPESGFSPLRRVYALSYQSSARAPGEHRVGVEVQLAGAAVKSAEQVYSIDLQPPNPILVNPDLQITRQAPSEDPFNSEMLLPTEKQIQIIVEFPDQHPRPLVRTTLYVDGMVADENTAEPFDSFTWNLEGYAISGEHQVVVEAVDSLGLSRTTISQPIALTVIQPPRGPAALLARYRQPITVVAVGLAALALTAILVTGRLRLPSARAALEARRAERDPVTQPVPATQTVPRSIAQDKPKRRLPARTKTPAAVPVPTAPAPASLLRLTPDGQPATANPLPLAGQELTLGTDPEQSSLLLDDASVSAAHARLRRTADGAYLLMDNGSVAGTWVNFKPVPAEGQLLQHGDMIHFGRLFFRFALLAAPRVPEPKIETPIPEE